MATRAAAHEQPIDAGAFGTQVRRLGGQTVERQRGQQRHAVERRNRIEAQSDLVRDGIAVEDAWPAAHSLADPQGGTDALGDLGVGRCEQLDRVEE